MATQERLQGRTPERPSEAGEVHAAIGERSRPLKAKIDSLADEIDDILEENAEEFVRSYIQRGGE